LNKELYQIFNKVRLENVIKRNPTKELLQSAKATFDQCGLIRGRYRTSDCLAQNPIAKFIHMFELLGHGRFHLSNFRFEDLIFAEVENFLRHHLEDVQRVVAFIFILFSFCANFRNKILPWRLPFELHNWNQSSIQFSKQEARLLCFLGRSFRKIDNLFH